MHYVCSERSYRWSRAPSSGQSLRFDAPYKVHVCLELGAESVSLKRAHTKRMLCSWRLMMWLIDLNLSFLSQLGLKYNTVPEGPLVRTIPSPCFINLSVCPLFCLTLTLTHFVILILHAKQYSVWLGCIVAGLACQWVAQFRLLLHLLL